MKYENIEQVNKLIRSIKQDEAEINKLVSGKELGTLKVVVTFESKAVQTIGVGDFEHKYTRFANIFIEDCIQNLRDRITRQKEELESL